MTEAEAHKLGIFTNWKVFTCQNCDSYHNFTHLTKVGTLILCPKCKRKIEGKQNKKAQQQLFDEQTPLFS